MRAITFLVFIFSLLNISAISAQESSSLEQDLQNAFISDELFIYMHAGSGTNYRIVGSINAGTEIQLTGKQANNFTEIIDSKERTAWVETRYINTNPSLRSVIAQLNSEMASYTDTEEQLNITISEKELLINELTTKHNTLDKSYKELSVKYQDLESQVSNQDLELKKQYFFYGAIVLGIGLLLGIVLPHLAAKKRKTQSWG